MSIESFVGDYRFLSNFFPAPVVLDGMTYPTVEHAYQAAKTLNRKERYRILADFPPSSAKRTGRHLTLRLDWDEVKLGVMLDLLRQKFRASKLKLLLLQTGCKELIEGNTWGDTYWGVCNGVGANHLGRLLMQVRRELLDEEKL